MPDEQDSITSADQETDGIQDSAPDQAATEAPATSETQTVHADEPATAAPQGQDQTGSLTPPNSQKTDQQPPPAEKPQVDWEKRYRDQQSYMDRQISTWKQKMEDNSRQTAELSKWRQEQEQRAQASSLKRWSKAHPDHPKFNSVLERARAVDTQLRSIPANLPPEQQEVMRNAIMSALNPDEQREIQEYRETSQNFQRDWFTDPQGTLMPMVQPMVQQMIQQQFQKMEAYNSVQRDLQDPSMAPLVEKYRDDYAKALKDGVPYEYTNHLLKQHAEINTLRERLQKLSGKAAQADEQRRLAKGEASITRDPRTPTIDPYKAAKREALESGIPLDSAQFARLVAKHTKE